MEKTTEIQQPQASCWIKPIIVVVGFLRGTETCKAIEKIQDDNAAPLDLLIRDLFALCNLYLEAKGPQAPNSNSEIAAPNTELIQERRDHCSKQWRQVRNNTLGYFASSPLLKMGCFSLFISSSWTSPRVLLFSMASSLLLFKNSTAITQLADEQALQWVEKNNLSFGIISGAAGGVLLLWNLNGVGMITALPHTVFSMTVSLTTGFLGGAYLARTNVLGEARKA